MGMVCLSMSAAVGLGEYIGATRTWVLSAWMRCGPLPEAPPKPAPAGSFGDPP